MLIIEGARIADGTDGDIRGDRGRRVELGRDGIAAIDGPPRARTDVVVEADGLVVAPGFVDLQINGGFGIDLARDPHALWDLGRRLPSTGVTAFLPTIVSSGERTRAAALEAIRSRPPGYLGAEPVGLHFEGPMLSVARRGAHPAAALRPPDRGLVERWSRTAGVRMVTLAPELPDALEVIRLLADRDVTVSLGHSNASSDEATRGVAAGASFVTHLFNAMAPLHHREPGLAGVAMTEPGLTVGVIADGVHLDPRVMALVWRALGPDRLALVTDAVAAMGDGARHGSLGPSGLTASGGEVRNADGVLAGSVLTMDAAVRNLVEWAGCPLDDALRCASTTPAAAVGERRRGRVASGAAADVVLLDDDATIVATFCGGELVHVEDGAVGRFPAELVEGGRRWRS